MTFALNSVRSTRLVFSTLLLLLSFGAVSSRSLATPPGIVTPASANPVPIVIAETLTAEQWREQGDNRSNEDVKGSIADYTQAIQLAPNEMDYYHARAKAYIRNNDKERALADFNQAIKVQPDSPSAHGERAIFYCTEGDYKNAIADWDQTVKMLPVAVTFSQRANCLVKMGDHKNAIVGYTNAIELNAKMEPPHSKLKQLFDAMDYFSRGQSYQALGNSKAAITDFDQALKLMPNEAEIYYERAIVKRSLGQKQAAIQDFKKSVELYGIGNSDRVENALKQIAELK
jgi:tetratricopeptide (TPR) repeat protein